MTANLIRRSSQGSENKGQRAFWVVGQVGNALSDGYCMWGKCWLWVMLNAQFSPHRVCTMESSEEGPSLDLLR
jgi:hypothetical protein